MSVATIPRERESSWRRILPAGIEWLPAILIAASLLPRIAFWFRRDFNHDDFAFGWGTWNYARGGAGYTYGFVFLLTELLKPLFLIFPESFLPLDIARVLVLFAYLLNLYLVYRIARRFGSKAWALAACAVAAWQPDLIMRAEDIRTDPFGTTCILGGALLLLGYGPKARFERAGILFGLAVILDYKFGVVAPFAAAAVVMIAWPRWLKPLLRLGAGAALPVVLYLGRLVLKETWRGFSSGLEQTALSLKIGGEGQVAVHAAAIFHLSPVTFLLAGIGAVGLGLHGFSRRSRDLRTGIYAVLVVAFFAVFLRLNPFFFPYNFNLFAPLLATLVPGIGLLVARSDSSRRPAILALLLTCLTTSAEGFPAFARVLGRSNAAQKRVVRWIWKATAPDEHVFDWQGIALFRPSIYHWWIFSGLAPRYDTGTWYSVADELQRYRVTLIIWNYRLGWLNRRDGTYLATHYVPIDSCLLAPGHVFRAQDFERGDVVFSPSVEGNYRTSPSVPGLLIDGKPVPAIVHLTAAEHRFGFEPGRRPPEAFALVYSTPLRDHAGRPCPVNEPLLNGFS